MDIQKDMEVLIHEIEERLISVRQSRTLFAEFLEEKMDEFDYSNTSLAKKVFHRIEKKGEGMVSYVPVTRQTIGSWMKGSMPSSREIYISLGMAFDMTLQEINHILLETYMGYGLYCKNIEDALWIAVVNGLFDLQDFELIKAQTEAILEEPCEEDDQRSLATMDLWEMLAQTTTLDQFYDLIRAYREEFRDGARSFGRCLEEVIEEEYGYYDRATQLLKDIGLLHCEAQFSKIKAGKAIVTREWLLRFCIALQPTYESIEKLLAKAQMEPLGITPAELILEMIARYKSNAVANNQEIWQMIEAISDDLRQKGYEIEEDLCRKYDSVYELPKVQKRWLSLCIGRQLVLNRKQKDYGYEKLGYCRYTVVDRILFDEVNRYKKNNSFKKQALQYEEHPTSDWEKVEFPTLEVLSIPKNYQADELELEKFEDYCYMRRPSRLSKDFIMNDNYFYSAMLYSIWTGKCYKKDMTKDMALELCREFDEAGLPGEAMKSLLLLNLDENAEYHAESEIERLMELMAVSGL